MKKLFLSVFTGVFLLFGVSFVAIAQQDKDTSRKLNVIIFGAHPDDAEHCGGTAYKWVQSGANVLLVSLTNGDAGHQSIPAKELASIRAIEARNAGRVIGVKYIILNNHDGELMPTLENRKKVIKLIRDWDADIVVSPRPYDYHPDHRNTGILVMDAAYMVTVPKIVPEAPYLKNNPLFLWISDPFIHPQKFHADVTVGIDGEAIEKRIDMLDKHVSQVYDWLPFNSGTLDQVPESALEKRIWLGKIWKSLNTAEPYRDKLIEIYGKKRGSEFKYAEAFEDSGYGTPLTKDNLYYYFPFLR